MTISPSQHTTSISTVGMDRPRCTAADTMASKWEGEEEEEEEEEGRENGGGIAPIGEGEPSPPPRTLR